MASKVCCRLRVELLVRGGKGGGAKEDNAWKSLLGVYTFSYIRPLCDMRLRTMVVGPPSMLQRHAASSSCTQTLPALCVGEVDL